MKGWTKLMVMPANPAPCNTVVSFMSYPTGTRAVDGLTFAKPLVKDGLAQPKV